MSDIFLSYAHEDQDRIKKLAKAFQDQGWTVFWDRTIPAGGSWRETIDRALETARCVVVVWSSHSIISRWVCEEAEEGQERKILVPILFDNVKPPMGFRSIQAANLTKWDGGVASEEFQHLIDSIARIVAPPKTSPKPPSSVPPIEKEGSHSVPPIEKGESPSVPPLCKRGVRGDFIENIIRAVIIRSANKSHLPTANAFNPQAACQ